jgi:hypothetical protein
MAGLLVEVKLRIIPDGTSYPELAVGEVYRFPCWLGLSKRPYEVSDLLNHSVIVYGAMLLQCLVDKPKTTLVIHILLP